MIDELLNVERNPRRPQYVMASELPLNLFDCQFEDEVDWRYDEESVAFVVRRFQALWTEHQVRASMLRAALEQLHGVQRDAGHGKVEHQGQNSLKSLQPFNLSLEGVVSSSGCLKLFQNLN